MKIIIIAIALAFMSLAQLQAQDKGTIEVGIAGGLNLSSVSDIQGDNSSKARVAFNFAASGEYYFSDRWGIKTKLVYDSKGWKEGFIDTFDSFGNMQRVTTDFKVNYLTIPVMANWHFGSTRKWYLNFGGYAGFLLNAEATETGTDVKEGFNSTDFGVVLGIGYKFEVSENVKLFVEYDAQTGFIDVFKNNTGDSVRNSRDSLNFGAIFNL